MARVVVAEPLADAGLDLLRAAGHDIDIRNRLSADDLRRTIVGAHGLIVRSATQVDAELLAAGESLVVVGRAGVGLDNVDVAAASERGVIVCNAPYSNVVSAAEMTVALMLALARHVPQAHQALAEGRWERGNWGGMEICRKTVGILGLGRVGRLVAQRIAPFDVALIAYDPYVSAESARAAGVDMVSFEELLEMSDIITLHMPRTAETADLLGAENLAKCRPHALIVNTARGGILDEAAAAVALEECRLGGVAVDVYASEPATDSPLFGRPDVVATPHLGASTTEAQDRAGTQIAEQVNLALAGDPVPYAVNA
ncbi:hydroxyacid dehydrogenase [Candidatus Poriferisodalis sp.]|uniref:hydroxyacid dehydrogenase n=1 Tax=Candidatus Poriferisodalis sp. TaxID=3101277 RepID=UPI003B020CAC